MKIEDINEAIKRLQELRKSVNKANKLSESLLDAEISSKRTRQVANLNFQFAQLEKSKIYFNRFFQNSSLYTGIEEITINHSGWHKEKI